MRRARLVHLADLWFGIKPGFGLEGNKEPAPLSPLRDAPQSYVLAAFFHSFVGTVYGSEILHQLNMVNIPSFTRFHTCWVVSRVSEPSTVISGENLIYLQENPKKVGHAKKKHKHLGCQLSHTQGSWS